MQKNYNKSLGDSIKCEKTNNRLLIVTENGSLALTFFVEGIVNICISKESKTHRPFSYAVTDSLRPLAIQSNENDNSIEINNGYFITHIQKNPVRIQFLTLDRKILCADEPSFGTSWIGNEVTTYKSIQQGEKFIGLGAKTGNLDRKGKAYINWNTDNFAYGIDADPLYASIPFYIGIHNRLCYGIFLDNSYKSVFNFGASTNRFVYFSVEDGEMNYYFIHRNSIPEIIETYTLLSGRMELPPLWSLGLHQCRYSYYPDKEVLRIAQTYREKEIPCDALWLDIHYMANYKVFTFDTQKFSNPQKLSKHLNELNFKTVVIIDPGVKTEKGYEVYDDGTKNNVFVQYPDQTHYEAEVWPGWSCFPDFTHEKVREWWGKWMGFYVENGIEGFWNDMNEPASWGQHTPDLIEFNYEGEKATHKRARNVYGMQMARATFESTKKQMKGKRPFVLTRAGFAGIQRYAALWTGDNVASDEHMMLGVRLLNSLGLSGIPFSGYDVGGFAGEASPELFARWISIGAFSPFFRCHSMINSRSAEPWSFGEKTYEIAQNYVKLRYQLLPYLYTAFYEASQTGMPIVRSLAMYWPYDEKVFLPSYQHQYSFGPSILVCPVESTKEFNRVYLPEGEWYNFHTDDLYSGKQEIIVETPLEKLPLFIKAGSIIPMQSSVQSTEERPDGMLRLHVYNGVDNSYNYYEDDGKSYKYIAENYYKRMISFRENKLELGKVSGSYPSKFNRLKIYLHGFKKIKEIKIDDKMAAIQEEAFCFIKPISNFDPFSKNSFHLPTVKLQTIELALSTETIFIEWR